MTNKTVKPTSAEKKIMDSRLRKMYPQMYAEGSSVLYNKKPSAGSRIKMAIGRALKKKKKPFTSTNTKNITSRLKQAGITDSEIKKLRGQKK